MTSLNNDCPICKSLPSLHRRVITPCNHCFCTQCFFTWIKTGKNCPLCRRIFIEDPVEEARDTLMAINQQITTDNDIMIHLRDTNAVLTMKNMRLKERNNLLTEERLRLNGANRLQRELKNVYKEKIIELQRHIDYKKDWLDLYNTKISIQKLQNQRNRPHQ